MDIVSRIQKKNDFNLLTPGVLLSISILLIYFTVIGTLSLSIISFIFNPFVDLGLNGSRNIKNTLNGLSNYEKIINEYYELKEKVLIYEKDVSLVDKLIAENEQLKSQLKVSTKDNDVLRVQVLDILEDENRVIINSGTSEGIKEKSEVYINNVFIGYVDTVSENRASVIMMNKRGFTLKGALVSKKLDEDSTIENINKIYMNNRVAQVVIVGNGNEIWVENIPTGKAKIGDVVIVADDRYQSNYIVGYISELDNDLARATQKGLIKQYFNPYNLNYYYINR